MDYCIFKIFLFFIDKFVGTTNFKWFVGTTLAQTQKVKQPVCLFLKVCFVFRNRPLESVEEMNLNNSNNGIKNGSGDYDQINGKKIESKKIDSEGSDIEMESQNSDDKNTHTNGYHNGNSHDDVEDMGNFILLFF